MSIVKCPECGGNVSALAEACPHCGYPLRKAETANEEYVLSKGKSTGSGFATFLRVLAVIAWIGGLIIAIAAANVTVVGRYYNTTEFSFSAFLTAFLSYFIYGVLLMCMAAVVDHVAATYSMVTGLKLEKRRNVPPENAHSTLNEPPAEKEESPFGSDADTMDGPYTVMADGQIRCNCCGVTQPAARLDPHCGKCWNCGQKFSK